MMKKFQFTLNKLLIFKEQILKKEKNELASLRAQQQAAVNERDKLEAEMHLRNSEFIQKTAAGMSAQEMISEKGYLSYLVNQIRIYENTIIALGAKIDKQLSNVIEANKEVSSLEKLEEKQYEQYKKDVQKSEELFIDEYVTNSSFYKN